MSNGWNVGIPCCPDHNKFKQRIITDSFIVLHLGFSRYVVVCGDLFSVK